MQGETVGHRRTQTHVTKEQYCCGQNDDEMSKRLIDMLMLVCNTEKDFRKLKDWNLTRCHYDQINDLPENISTMGVDDWSERKTFV